MTNEELMALTDSELEALYKEVVDDLKQAVIDAPEDEWHHACFAAYCMVLEESKRRVIESVK